MNLADFIIPETDSRELKFIPVVPGRARTLQPAQVQEFNERGFISRLPVFHGDQLLQTARYIRGLVDDAVYAAARARSGMQRGQSLRRIAQGLRAKGVDADDTRAGRSCSTTTARSQARGSATTTERSSRHWSRTGRRTRSVGDGRGWSATVL